MRVILRLIVAGIAILTGVSRVGAQPNEAGYPRSFVVLGLAAAGYLTSHPEGGPAALGASVGVVRQTGLRTELRPLITILDTWAIADDIALCHLLPDESCLPDSIFPARLWTFELSGGFRPFPTMPVWLLAGGGVVVPQGAQPGQGSGDVPGTRAGTRGTWRLGIEGALGRSVNAPRVQLARSGYSRSMLSLSGLVSVSVLFPLVP